jgi:hypothetical protein
MADVDEKKGRESWEWGKFFKGFFDGRNYAKAVVLGFCMLVILIIVFSVTSTIRSRFAKPSTPTQAVGTNQGIIATKNEDKSGNSYSLFNLFNWK